MDNMLLDLIKAGYVTLAPDDIYESNNLPVSKQGKEREMREAVAKRVYGDYLSSIKLSHSIPVMDREVKIFLNKMPVGAWILDVGGCWGWHWRKIAIERPDIRVVVVDYIRSNLLHAKNILSLLGNSQVFLMHADATELPFFSVGEGDFDGFDGIWSVQALQHIPNFEIACKEIVRVIKKKGVFINYSLHITPLMRLAYFIFGKKFHISGFVHERYYLERANENQKKIIEGLFNSEVKDRYSECLFHPELKLTNSGGERSILGKIDSLMSGSTFFKGIARQRSFEVVKA